jgi:peptidoglycan hydrolase-like protein with peptidoglycan-binding domain
MKSNFTGTHKRFPNQKFSWEPLSAGILSYLRSLNPFNFFSVNPLYLLLILSSVPTFVGSSAVVSVAAPQKIAQVISAGNVSRPILQVGSKGDNVSELQAALKLLGYYKGAVDGNYNEVTATAVSQFKQAAGLNPDGIVDANTWQKLFPKESATRTATVPAPTTKIPSPITKTPSPPASSLPAPNPDSSFPAPSPKPRAARAARIASPSSEPRPVRLPARANPTIGNSSPEPRPATPGTTTTTTTTTVYNTPGRQSSTTRSVQTSRASRSAQVSTQQTTRTTASRSGQSTRTNSTSRSQETSGVQYTAEGLPILRLGMRGSDVVKLQERLSTLGYLESGVDGDFGASTETAVKALQSKFGMEPDGVVGGATWDILNRRRRRSNDS